MPWYPLPALPSLECELDVNCVWCAFRGRIANGELQRNSRNLDRRDTNSLNGERNGCVWHTATMWDVVDTLMPICRAHTTPVDPATYFAAYGQTQTSGASYVAAAVLPSRFFAYCHASAHAIFRSCFGRCVLISVSPAFVPQACDACSSRRVCLGRSFGLAVS